MNFKDLTKNHINNPEVFISLEKYVALIEKHNKVMNLTGFSGQKLWEEGIYESIVSLDTAFGKNIKGKLLDIGAGVGFPSIPYLINNPDLELTIFEPLKKRLNFLEIVKNELNLNIKLINTRVEDFLQKEIFDYVTARAVSSLKNLLQAGAHVPKINGHFGFIKGPKYQDEIHSAKQVLNELDWPFTIKKVMLPNKQTFIIKIKKNKPSPNKYPLPWKDIKS